MDTAVIIYTRRPMNPVSSLIRWALPVSRFKWGRASHSMLVDGDHVIHATMLHGVIRQPFGEAMKNQIVVSQREYEVPDLQAGLEWARSQVGKDYDFKGAFGLSLDPNRDWTADDAWFCHEFCAAFLHACGRKLFERFGHVTDASLMLACSKVSTGQKDGKPIFFSRKN